MSQAVWDAVAQSTQWLNQANGTDDREITGRILKITEEAGEAAGAWIGVLGTNPRKGVTHTRDQVAAELADVAISALVAIASLDRDPKAMLEACAAKLRARQISDPVPQHRTAPRGVKSQR